MKLSICMLAPEFPPKCAGIGNYIYNLSKKLIELGHTVTVITRGSWRGVKIEDMDGIKVYRARFAPIYPFHIELYGISINHLLKSIGNEFDVIHTHSPSTPVPKRNIPNVLTFHICSKQEAKAYTEIKDLYSLGVRTLVRIAIRNEINCIRKASKLTSVSLGVARELAQYGVNPDVVAVIGNGVDIDLFTPKYERQEARILYTGYLMYKKGVIDLVKSAEYVCKEHPDASFTIIGDGPLRPTLEKMVHQLNLERNFSFLGYIPQSQLIKYYQNETIYVLPSYYEGLPTTILEAMSCRMPVVATDVSGPADAVINGETGFLVPPREPRLLADSILRLLAYKDLRERMGRAGRERVERHFTWDIVAERVLAIYNEVL